MLKNLPCGPISEQRGFMLCFSISQYKMAFMVPSMNCSSPVPVELMQPQTMTLPPPCLTAGKTHLYCTPHLVAATHAWHHLNQISWPWSHQTTGHGSSNTSPQSACLQQTVCGLSCASFLEEAFFLGRQPCRPIWCSVSMRHSYVYFPKTTSGYDAQHD